MSPARRILAARLVLAAFVAVCALWLARLDYLGRIATDVLELIPPDERDPELALVRALAGERQGRIALFVLQDAGAGAGTMARAGAAFAGALLRSGDFRDAFDAGDPEVREGLGREIFARRFDLLLPGWLAQREREHAAAGGGVPWPDWLAERVCDGLDTFLARPEAAAFEPLLGADPLLLVPAWVESMPGAAGYESAAAADGRVALVWAETVASPMREEGQGPVFRAVEAALAAAREIAPAATLRWTAVSRFAAESRRRIETEVKVLNALSLVAVVIVLVAGLRRVWQVAHLLPIMVGSLLGAWTITTMVFDRVHVLVLVIGSLLSGVAVDYGLHIFLHRGQPGEDYLERLRHLWRPLVGGVVTSLAGFVVLATSGLPLLRQTGVFVSAGIGSAALVALAWFAQVSRGEGSTRLEGRWVSAGPRRARLRISLQVVIFLGVVTTVTGLWRLKWHDDIRELEIRSPGLWANDALVRAHFDQGTGTTLMLTRGDDAAGARAALGRLQDWLVQVAPGSRIASVGLALPLPDDHVQAAARVRRLDAWEGTLRGALEGRGYESTAFEPFFTAWRDLGERTAWPAYGELAAGLAATLRGPSALAIDLRPGATWFAVAIEEAPGLAPPVDTATVPLTQLETLNHLFSRYRVAALRLSVIGLAVAAACVVAVFGVKRGLRMFAISAGACLFVFGVFGWLGQTLNLFHLLGAFLAVCLTIDYAIFAGHSLHDRSEVPPSVRLSALTTIASFTVLGFSAIPVVSALGSTVASVVASGWTLVEVAAFLAAEDATADSGTSS